MTDNMITKNIVLNNVDISNNHFVVNGNFCYENKIKIEIRPDNQISLSIVEIKDNFEVELELEENASVDLSILLKSSANTIKMTINLAKNAKLVGYLADFSSINNRSEITINLNGEYADADWHLAAISDNKDNKNLSISINHNSPLTTGIVENYGVCKGESKLTFAGTSYIKNGCVKSKTRQNAKIMVFDDTSDATAKPILKIDENDVEASHGAVVGKINDEHMFYLTSRGISRSDARSLITLGYLKPILKGFKSAKEQEEILGLIEGGIN